MNNIQIALVVSQAWDALLKDYSTGRVILENEKHTQYHFANLCTLYLRRNGFCLEVLRERKKTVEKRGQFLSRTIDVVVEPNTKQIDQSFLIQLKLYHDQADWRESTKMKNTVESDLKFSEGRDNVCVGIIDTIPSRSSYMPYELNWRAIKLDEKAYDLYNCVNTTALYKREQIQRAAFIQGSELKRIG